MLRVAVLSGLSLAMLGAAAAQDAKEDAKQDTVEVHGKSLALSCAEWKRNQDGSWTNASPLLVGTDTVKDVTLRGAKETSALEVKCANGSTPAATPSRGEGQTKHARHRHHGAADSGGT